LGRLPATHLDPAALRGAQAREIVLGADQPDGNRLGTRLKEQVFQMVARGVERRRFARHEKIRMRLEGAAH